MGSLTAGGYPVHRTRKGTPSTVSQNGTSDTVPISERYQDLAAHIHRTAVAPVGDTYIWGCVCGAASKVHEPGLRSADMAAMKHVIDEAAKLESRLEGTTQHGDISDPD